MYNLVSVLDVEAIVDVTALQMRDRRQKSLGEQATARMSNGSTQRCKQVLLSGRGLRPKYSESLSFSRCRWVGVSGIRFCEFGLEHMCDTTAAWLAGISRVTIC